MIKLNRPLVSIDLETTGVDVSNDRIVQIALVTAIPGGTRSSTCRLINPGVPIPKKTTEIHGITDEMVAGRIVPTFAQVAKSLENKLTDVDITGYNVKSFDVPLLSNEFKRCGIDWPPEDTVIVDAYRIFKQQEPRTLANALFFYSGEVLDPKAAHDAKVDATAALNTLMGQSIMYGPEDGKGMELPDLVELATDPDWLDEDGKVKWDGDVAVVNFGKWDGERLNDVDPTYFDWVLKQDFGEEFKAICRAAKAGEFPVRGSI